MSKGTPVEVCIEHHYGSSGDWRLVIRDYLSSDESLLTKEIKGYYKTEDGIVNKAVSEAEKYHSGDKWAYEHEGRPTRIQVSNRFDRDLVESALKLEDLEDSIEVTT